MHDFDGLSLAFWLFQKTRIGHMIEPGNPASLGHQGSNEDMPGLLAHRAEIFEFWLKPQGYSGCWFKLQEYSGY